MFIENLFSQRFNFFIVIFSLVIAASGSANTQAKLVAVLWIGEILCFLVGLTIYRIYVKLIWILQSLHKIPDHPVAKTGAAMRPLGRRGLFGVNSILGVVIPSICCLTLFVGALLASAGILTAK